MGVDPNQRPQFEADEGSGNAEVLFQQLVDMALEAARVEPPVVLDFLSDSPKAEDVQAGAYRLDARDESLQARAHRLFALILAEHCDEDVGLPRNIEIAALTNNENWKAHSLAIPEEARRGARSQTRVFRVAQFFFQTMAWATAQSNPEQDAANTTTADSLPDAA